MLPFRIIFLFLLPLLFAVSLHAQVRQEESDASGLRVGVQAGVQTNLIRYTVFPYRGEFQSATRESVVPGFLLQYRINEHFAIQAEVNSWAQDWNVSHDGDPRVQVDRQNRSVIEFPLLLQYRVPFVSVPVYISGGPMLTVGTDETLHTEVRYRNFTEKNGWQVTTKRFEERELRLGGVAEIGLDVPLSQVIALQPAMRFFQPFSNIVDDELLTVRDFSYWRARLAVLIAI